MTSRRSGGLREEESDGVLLHVEPDPFSSVTSGPRPGQWSEAREHIVAWMTIALLDMLIDFETVCTSATRRASLMDQSESLIIPRGFRAGAVKAGIKPSGGLDLAVLAADGPCCARPARSRPTASVLRRCGGAAIDLARRRHPRDRDQRRQCQRGHRRRRGDANARADGRRWPRQLLGCQPDQVLVASTGVIGHQLPDGSTRSRAVTRARSQLSADGASFQTAAQAILTTDTQPKVVSLPATIGGRARSRCSAWPRGRR